MNTKVKKVISYIMMIASCFSFMIMPVKAEENIQQVVSVNTQEVNVYMFRGDGCTLCSKVLTWFDEIEETEGNYFNLITYEVWNDEANKKIMDRVTKYLNEEVAGVPYIVIGNKTFTISDDSYKEEILNTIHDEYIKNVDDRFDVMKDINANKDLSSIDITSIIIVIIIFGLAILVFEARKTSNGEDKLNYEEIIYNEQEEEKKKPSKTVKKVKTASKTASKTTTKSTSKTTSKVTSKKSKK